MGCFGNTRDIMKNETLPLRKVLDQSVLPGMYLQIINLDSEYQNDMD